MYCPYNWLNQVEGTSAPLVPAAPAAAPATDTVGGAAEGRGGRALVPTLEEQQEQDEVDAEAKAERAFLLRHGEELNAREFDREQDTYTRETVQIAVDAAARLHNRGSVVGGDVAAKTAGNKEEVCPVCLRTTYGISYSDKDYHTFTRYDDGTIVCEGAAAQRQWFHQRCGICKKVSGNFSQVMCGCAVFGSF